MPDTNRTKAALQALLADNTSADITPQRVRDFLESVFTLATKGDLTGIDAAGLRQALSISGNDGWVLTEDAASTLGFKWAVAGAGAHPNLATHDALGLATDAELTTHAGAADPHTGYVLESAHASASYDAGHHAAVTIGADAQHSLVGQVLSGVDTGNSQKGHVAFDTTNAAAVGTAAPGTAATASHRDHVHPTGAGTPSTQAFGDAAATGTGPAASMTDHKHAMPANPVTAHEAAGDPHTGYRLESADHSHASTGIQGGIVAASVITIADAGSLITAVEVEAALQELAATNRRYRTITYVIDGGGFTLTTGVKGDLEIPFACTINRVTLLAAESGSIVLDLWKDTYANYPPTVADTITASAKPTISSTTKAQDATLTGWTTSITAGDTLRFNVDSVTTITRVTISLRVTVT